MTAIRTRHRRRESAGGDAGAKRHPAAAPSASPLNASPGGDAGGAFTGGRKGEGAPPPLSLAEQARALRARADGFFDDGMAELDAAVAAGELVLAWGERAKYFDTVGALRAMEKRVKAAIRCLKDARTTYGVARIGEGKR